MAGYIAHGDVVKPLITCNAIGSFECLDRRRVKVGQPVCGKETGKMHWDVMSEFFNDPAAHLFHIIGVIVYGGNHEVDDLEPYPLISDNLKVPQHGSEFCG